MSSPAEPFLSIIIVNYNTRELLRQCLASVEIHEPDAQVIVADNASQDGSAAMVRRLFPRVGLVEMGSNAGFAAANNAALLRARGKYLVLLNSDVILPDDTLSRCTSWLNGSPEVGASSPRLIGVDDRPQQCTYPFPRFRDLARQAFRLAPLRRETDEAVWLAGTALVLRGAALASIGGQLDERYWMYWEDCDLSARLLKRGWRLEPFEGGWIRHLGGASGGGSDSNRRPDLHAWYMYGMHQWFATHRPRIESAGLWLLDGVDVLRKILRGTLRSDRSIEKSQARALARVLVGRIRGRRPPVPGTSRKKKPTPLEGV